MRQLSWRSAALLLLAAGSSTLVLVGQQKGVPAAVAATRPREIAGLLDEQQEAEAPALADVEMIAAADLEPNPVGSGSQAVEPELDADAAPSGVGAVSGESDPPASEREVTTASAGDLEEVAASDHGAVDTEPDSTAAELVGAGSVEVATDGDASPVAEPDTADPELDNSAVTPAGETENPEPDDAATAEAGAASAVAAKQQPHSAPSDNNNVDAAKEYGFYLHVFRQPAAVIHQVRKLREFFPDSPIYIMSDGGNGFNGLCQRERCKFVLCPPANDRWHPWPFLRRLYDAALFLQTKYVILLEPDNTIHGPITRPPTHDAGGVYVSSRGFPYKSYIERLAKQRNPGFTWTQRSMLSGLCGGSYYRTEAILDAFSDESVARIDWNLLAERGTKEIFSSDFAMVYALAARGWEIDPWEDSAQMGGQSADIPKTGPADAAFRHYSASYPGGKPTYQLELAVRDEPLFEKSVSKHSKFNSNCQVCYNFTMYKDRWGSTACTNQIPVKYSGLLKWRYGSRAKRKKDEIPPKKVLKPHWFEDLRYSCRIIKSDGRMEFPAQFEGLKRWEQVVDVIGGLPSETLLHILESHGEQVPSSLDEKARAVITMLSRQLQNR